MHTFLAHLIHNESFRCVLWLLQAIKDAENSIAWLPALQNHVGREVTAESESGTAMKVIAESCLTCPSISGVWLDLSAVKPTPNTSQRHSAQVGCFNHLISYMEGWWDQDFSVGLGESVWCSNLAWTIKVPPLLILPVSLGFLECTLTQLVVVLEKQTNKKKQALFSTLEILIL